MHLYLIMESNSQCYGLLRSRMYRYPVTQPSFPWQYLQRGNSDCVAGYICRLFHLTSRRPYFWSQNNEMKWRPYIWAQNQSYGTLILFLFKHFLLFQNFKLVTVSRIFWFMVGNCRWEGLNNTAALIRHYILNLNYLTIDNVSGTG